MEGNDTEIADPGEPDWVLETTVLSAFALAGRLDILQMLYSGRATWTIAVQDELMRGVRGQPRLGDALAIGWLGEPRAVFAVERVEHFRRRLGGRANDERHLGEATCIALAEKIEAGVLLDDRDAKRVAESSGLSTGTTISILQIAVAQDQVSPEQAKALIDELIERHGRRLPRLSVDDFRRRAESE